MTTAVRRAKARSEGATPVLWPLVNAVQAVFLIAWTALWGTLSLLSIALTWSPRTALWIARVPWARGLLWGAGARVVTTGGDGIAADRPHIYVMNHQSMLDIPAAFVSAPVPLRFVSKRILAWIPVLGWYMWAVGMVFVDRADHRSAVRSLDRAVRQIQAGCDIVAFPEGTRSRDGTIQPFKKGVFVLAIKAGVPIVPMAIHKANKVCPNGTFRVRPGEVRVALGEPIPTAGLTLDDREALVARVHAAVVDLHNGLVQEEPARAPRPAVVWSPTLLQLRR